MLDYVRPSGSSTTDSTGIMESNDVTYDLTSAESIRAETEVDVTENINSEFSEKQSFEAYEGSPLPLPRAQSRSSKRVIYPDSDSVSDKEEDDPKSQDCSTSVVENNPAKPFLKAKIATKINWKDYKFSRPEREKRKRESSIHNQSLITNYFSPVDEMAKLLKENQALRNLLSQKLNDFITRSTETKLRSSNRFQFNDPLKQFATYLFIIGGRLLYETLSSNLKGILPTISTIQRQFSKMSDEFRIKEGEFRFSQLKLFLINRELPLKVWISEDATRVTGRIEYCSKSNKLVGFLLPSRQNVTFDTDYFTASSVKKIQIFFQQGQKCNYAYVIMAQPLCDKSPAFCVSIFRTDNKFTYSDVLKRWDIMKQMASNIGIEILGFSSDGDTRLMKSTRLTSTKLETISPSEEDLSKDPCYRPWFHLNINCRPLCIQDTVHIGTKLRNRFTKPYVELKMGTYRATSDHLRTLIATVTKDKHLLTSSDINPEDRMNFRTVEKITSLDVTEHLQKIENSQATQAYLLIMRHVLRSFLEKCMKLSERIYSIWFAIFFLRIWKNWLISNHLSVSKYFITANCHQCIEINGHVDNVGKNFP
ncbi:hypothetical protein FQR65_LT18283 [Abscondita terminalis]|nr:hypothetical protein FQR65_LT18283 [Abscondita terminalis]